MKRGKRIASTNKNNYQLTSDVVRVSTTWNKIQVQPSSKYFWHSRWYKIKIKSESLNHSSKKHVRTCAHVRVRACFRTRTHAHPKIFKYAHAHARAREKFLMMRTRTHAHAWKIKTHVRARAWIFILFRVRQIWFFQSKFALLIAF